MLPALRQLLRRSASSLSQRLSERHQLLLAPGRLALRNEYYALRHGWSKANEAGVIVSRIDSGARLEYGLHATGREQASAAGEAFRDIVGERPVAILSSDFSRTYETAKTVAAAVNADVEAEPALRERDFGDFELGPNTAYDQVWARDAVDATHTDNQVEAAAAVLARAAGAVRRVEESAREGHVVLLVSHGDCLQILQTAFAGVDVSAHRSLPHLETCELRRLALLGVS